jgi:predicted dehydrogenase
MAEISQEEHSIMQKTSVNQAATPWVCVVGCGHWGQNLVRNFAEMGNLGGLCDDNALRLESFAARYPGIKTYENYGEVLADPAIDAVVLATPAELHGRMGLAALEAGKDLFVEKPLALEVADGFAMNECANSKNRILMVGHLLRYHPAILKIQDLITRGELGKIEYIYSNRVSMGKIRKEENALWSFAPHDISVILALMGEAPVQVTATGGAYLQPNIADVTVSNLLFGHGARAHIFVSWLHPYKEQRLVVIGSKGMVTFEDSRPDNKLVSFDKRIEFKNGAMEAARPQGVSIPIETAEPLRLECQHFIDCILCRSEPRTCGEEGLRVVQVLQASQRSMQMNGEPVQVHAYANHKVLAL